MCGSTHGEEPASPLALVEAEDSLVDVVVGDVTSSQRASGSNLQGVNAS